MALPHELLPFTVHGGDFLYKIGNQTEWIRPQPPDDGLKQNCYGIKFDSEVTIMQKHPKDESVCHVKFTLKQPIIKTEEDQLVVEAACTKVHNPHLATNGPCPDPTSQVGTLLAKTLSLAWIDRRITAVKLTRFSEEGLPKARSPEDRERELGGRICALIDRGYRAGLTQASEPGQGKRQQDGSWELIEEKAEPQPTTASGSARRGKKNWMDLAQWEMEEENKRQAQQLATADGEALQLATAQGERRLRKRLEYDRRALLQTVTSAINAEWDRHVGAAVAEYRTGRAKATTE